MNRLINSRFQKEIIHLANSNTKFDLIFFDPPTGQTNEEWDKPFDVLDLEILWEVLKSDGTIVIWGTEKSNNYIKHDWRDYFKYNWYWLKSRRGSWIHANHRPTTVIDELSVFSKLPFCMADKKMRFFSEPRTNLLEFQSRKVVGKIHPCEKPLDLCKFIVETYTKAGDSVLDICFGSGAILQAAKILGRDYFGFESNPTFFIDAEHRIRNKNI